MTAPSTIDLDLFGDFDHSRCADEGAAYGAAYCLATRKPGPCLGFHRPGTILTPPTPVKVPDAPSQADAAKIAAARMQDPAYRAAYLKAEQVAQQAGLGKGGHSAITGPMHDYAGALRQHEQAEQRAQTAYQNAQRAHDNGTQRLAAQQASFKAREAAAEARANAATARARLHAAARHKAGGGSTPFPMGGMPMMAADVTAYALGTDDGGAYALVGQMHLDCGIGEFCRNPLHPGPCKGWKHMLHAVSPGAYHAYERRRVDQLNARRAARVKHLQGLGHPVPAHLTKPIPYPTSGPSGPAPASFHPPTPSGAKAVLPATAQAIGARIAQRHQATADAKLDAQAQSLHDVVMAVQGRTNVPVTSVRAALAKAKASQGPGDKLTEHTSVQQAVNSLVGNLDTRTPGGLPDAKKDELKRDLADHIESGTPGVPKSVQDTLDHIKQAPAAAPAAPASPSAPGVPNAPHVPTNAPNTPTAVPDAARSIRIAQATRAVTQAAQHTDPQRLAAYDQLKPDDVTHMSPAGRRQIEADLKGLQGLAGRPGQNGTAKKAAEIHARLFGASASTPAVKSGPTPSAPLPAGTQAHVQHAVAMAHRSAPRSFVAKVQVPAYGKLTKAEFDALPDDTKGKIKADLHAARAKFLDPTKRVEVDKILNRLDPKGAPAHPPAAPSISSMPAKGYSDRVKTAVHAAQHGTHVSAVQEIGQLSRPELDSLDSADRKTVLDRLHAISQDVDTPAKGKEAAALHQIMSAKSVPSETSKTWDHSPTFHELAAQEAKGAGGAHRPKTVLDGHLETMKDPASSDQAVYSSYVHARSLAHSADDPAKARDEVEATRAALVADPKRSDELRTKLYGEAPHTSPDYKTVGTLGPNGHGLLRAAGDPVPSSGPTQVATESLFGVPQDRIDALPDFVQRAVIQRRNDYIRELHLATIGSSHGSRRTVLNNLLGPKGDDLRAYDKLDSRPRAMLQTWAKDERDAQAAAGNIVSATTHQRQLDAMEGRTYTPAQRAVMNAGMPKDQAHAVHQLLDRGNGMAEYKAIPTVYRKVIERDLANHGGLVWAYPDSAKEARHSLAYIHGDLTSYRDQAQTDAAAAAHGGIDRPYLADAERAAIYRKLSPIQFKGLDVGDRTDIEGDIAHITSGQAASTGGAIAGPDVRWQLQDHLDDLTGASSKRPFHVQDAIHASDPSATMHQRDRVSAYSKLTPGEYQGLPKVYQDAIESDITRIGASDPNTQAGLMKIIKPSWNPPQAPAAPVTTSTDPVIKAALDTLYGLHPRAHTSAHQMTTYGALRRVDFNTLQPHEQSALLGDLSYIATTSKGPYKAKAEKLIDRFTPPGTPSGHVPAQPISVPVNAVAGQTRDPNPAGTAGLLKVAASRGVSGDGWSRNPNGSTGPWGKYGAAGVMLRHIGADGQERYLIIQRGPGISDPGKWQFPGGAIDSKETPHEGAARETIEELGFKKDALESARVHGHHEFSIPGGWKYTSIAATVPTQLQPDLSTHHARAETSDAKWMTLAEIRKLDKDGKLLKPLANGALERNVVSLFPPTAHAGPVRPGPVTKRPTRLTGTPGVPKAAKPHKPSKGRDLLADKAAKDQLRQDVKKARQDVKKARPQYDGKTADGRLAAIGAMQGFDDTPTVVSKAEMDRLLATGDYIEAWRGVKHSGSWTGNGKTAAQINEEFRSGPAYYGTGVFGNGYYLATQKSVAENYSDHTKNSVIRILIPKEAKIINHDDAISEARANSVRYSAAKGHKGEISTLWDEGRYAAAKGHDGIEIRHTAGRQSSMRAGHVAKPGKPAYNWLNRSVLIVQEAE